MIREDPNSPAATLEAFRRENELLHVERAEFLEQLKQKDHEIDGLQHPLQMLLRRYFGRSSARLDPQQKLLFEDMLDTCIPETPAEETSDPQASDPEPSPSKRRGRGHGRRRLPSNLPREKVIHDLPEEEKPCPCRQKMRHLIGKETHEQLDYVPAKVKVIERIRLKYACPHCEAEASPGGPQIVVADKPMQPIEKGLAAPGLLSYVIVSKYAGIGVRTRYPP